ncbi:tyrosine-type recombinase/integrase, partial [Methylomonas sp. WH-1]|uniref:tyrosine-type recombinase/integrase n=2 Tax=unclassified Methylomonas TaxID=2608980 RepID=UPI00301661BA
SAPRMGSMQYIGDGTILSCRTMSYELLSHLVQPINAACGSDKINSLLAAVEYLLKHTKTQFLLNYRKEWLTEKFISLCDSLGIENFRLHDLRHEGVSSLFEKGLNMIEVSSISGHKDLSMLKRYTHINPSTLIDRI